MGDILEMAVGKLSELACADAQCERRFREVDTLAGDIFDERIKTRFRFYHRFDVFLSDDHAKAVEETLDALIFGTRDGELTPGTESFTPSPQEFMYLVAATRLRCLGLLWGLFPDRERKAPAKEDATFDNSQPTEPPWETGGGCVDSLQVQHLIETFPSRSIEYLRDYWKFKSWSESDKAILCSLLACYLPSVPVPDIPERIGDIRVRELALLLRVATSCTVGKSVCPLEVRLRMKPDSFCDLRKTHLAPVDWIVETFFDHGRNLFEIRANIPAVQRIPDPREGASLPIAYVDYAPALDFLGTVIQEVFDTASPSLENYRNTCIRTVRVESYYMAREAKREAEAFLPNQWALPLAAAVNASEVAGMTALVLRSFCKFGFNEDNVGFREQVAQVCEAVEQMHPCNVLILELVAMIRDHSTSWGGEPSEEQIKGFESLLDHYLIERADAGDGVANEAVKSEVLIGLDAQQVNYVIVYGYGRCVLSTLRKADFLGEVLLIDVPDHVRGRWVGQESDRIREALDLCDIRYRNVQLAALPVVLRRAKREGKSFVFLTGTRCVLREANAADEFLCPVGTWQIASVVNANGGETVALGESAKVVADASVIADIRQRLDQVSREIDSRPWVQVDVLTHGQEIKKKSDCLSGSRSTCSFGEGELPMSEAMTKCNEPTSPRVLISYSHDSPEHAARVADLANQLRRNGIDCWIDQFEPHPPQGWPMWMERQLARAKFVLLICSERYLRRFDGKEVPGLGLGVVWESTLIRNELYKSRHDNREFVAVGFDKGYERFIPLPLEGSSHYLLDDFRLDRETGYCRLYRQLTDQPKVSAAAIGSLSSLREQEIRADLVTVRDGSQLLLASLTTPPSGAPPRHDAAYAMRFLGFDGSRECIRDFINQNHEWMFEGTDDVLKQRILDDFCVTIGSLSANQPVGFALGVCSDNVETGMGSMRPDDRNPSICIANVDELRQFLSDPALFGRRSLLRRFAVVRHVFVEESPPREERQAETILKLLDEFGVRPLQAPSCVFWETDLPFCEFPTHRNPSSLRQLFEEAKVRFR